MTEYLNATKVAKILNVDVQMVRRRVQQGVISAERMPGKKGGYLIAVDDIEKIKFSIENERDSNSKQLCWTCKNFRNCSWATEHVHVDSRNNRNGNTVKKCSGYEAGEYKPVVNCPEHFMTELYRLAVKDYYKAVHDMVNLPTWTDRKEAEAEVESLRDFLPKSVLKLADKALSEERA